MQKYSPVSLHNLIVKLAELGLDAKNCSIGLIDSFVSSNVLNDCAGSKLWRCSDPLKKEVETLIFQSGVEAAVLISENKKQSCRFVYLRKNKCFELSSLSSFEQNYREKIEDICQDS